MKDDKFKKSLLSKGLDIVINCVLLLAVAYFFMILWNHFMPGMSGFEAINYTKAIMISFGLYLVEKYL